MKTLAAFLAGGLVGCLLYIGIKAPLPARKIIVALYDCSETGALVAMADKTGLMKLPQGQKLEVCGFLIQDDWEWTKVVTEEKK